MQTRNNILLPLRNPHKLAQNSSQAFLFDRGVVGGDDFSGGYDGTEFGKLRAHRVAHVVTAASRMCGELNVFERKEFAKTLAASREPCDDVG